jgi:hypothetical protein
VITAFLAALSLQVPGWTISPGVATVGDTVHLTRRVVAEPGVQAVAQPLISSLAVEPLANPAVGYTEGAILVRYTVAFFEAGEQSLLMPDIELMYGDGRVETISGDTVLVRISSVLPAVSA